ncbi:MAG TPA: DNA repair exonuclease [Longimicrobiales bacterium]
MILAHLADLHLGYRAYHRLAPGGINARERDVALAFRAALDRIIELKPELVLVAGDVFHTVRPSNAAIADAFRQFARLRAGLPDAPVVVIAGNHDSPRAVETGSILRLLAEIPGVVVVDQDARAVHLEAIDASILCLPHNALASGEPIALEPDPDAAVNILMLHGTVAGGAADQKLRYVSEYGGVKVEATDIRPDRWDYIALGHYHIATELAPNMWYAGGIERTSTNIWEEAGGEKGFLTYDTDARKATFHPLPSREVIDLPRFSALRAAGGGGGEAPGKYLEPAEIDAKIRALVDGIPGGIEGKIVRLVITDVPRELFRALDHQRIRDYKAEALHFHLDARRPEVQRIVGVAAPGRRRTLEEEVRSFLRKHWQRSSREIDIDRLVALADRYMAEAAGGEPEDALVASESVGE